MLVKSTTTTTTAMATVAVLGTEGNGGGWDLPYPRRTLVESGSTRRLWRCELRWQMADCFDGKLACLVVGLGNGAELGGSR